MADISGIRTTDSAKMVRRPNTIRTAAVRVFETAHRIRANKPFLALLNIWYLSSFYFCLCQRQSQNNVRCATKCLPICEKGKKKPPEAAVSDKSHAIGVIN